MVVGLTLVALIAGLVIYFRSFVGPLLLAIVLAYLLHPLIAALTRQTRLSWRWGVNIVYLVLVIVVLGLVALLGVVIIQQLQSLINFVQNFVNNLPTFVADLTNRVYDIGPFELRPGNLLDLNALTNQLLTYVEPLLGRIGTLITSLAGSAAGTIGWGLFVILISYFLLAESRQVTNELIRVELPGYNEDLHRLGIELRKIWNAFLRGQLIISGLVIISYWILETILGMRFALGIAIIAGVGRFIPYLGPLVNWIVMAIVALFQGTNPFGLEPYQYALLVVVTGLVLDQIFDNLVSPRFLGNALGVHPAAVLVGALIASRLIGVIGLVLAAPVVATLKLLADYVLRKMFDQDPFPEVQAERRVADQTWARATRRAQAWWRAMRVRRE
jgi:predicted PurR-regulated permease PerM